MKIEQAIQKSYASGWRPKGQGKNLKGTTIKEMTASAIYMTNGDSIFLDPKFFQSLGKAIGWTHVYCLICDTSVEMFQECDCEDIEPRPQEAWLYKWHSLIDHLADDGSIEEWFEKL